jgi:hypothetical protein
MPITPEDGDSPRKKVEIQKALAGIAAKEQAEARRSAAACSAVVTRYPTGCFGIDYNGSMFHWWGFGEENVHAELERLRIPAKQVKWEERYYDRRYNFNDPRCYAKRKFIPQNDQGDGRRQTAPTSPPTSSPFHPPSC